MRVGDVGKNKAINKTKLVKPIFLYTFDNFYIIYWFFRLPLFL